MRVVGLAVALACLAMTAKASSRDYSMRVYPMLQESGLAYVIKVDEGGKIEKCQPADPETLPAVADAACAKIIARGVPAGVTPAIPTSPPGSWITNADFPHSAIEDMASGNVEVLFEVNEQGRVSGCLVFKSSGRADFDKLACAVFVVRARFKPASYKGRPTHAAGIAPVKFEA